MAGYNRMSGQKTLTSQNYQTAGDSQTPIAGQAKAGGDEDSRVV